MPSSKPRKNSDAGDDKPSKRRRTHDFDYEKLPLGHIRILQVTHELKRNGRRQLSAQLRSFHVDHLPQFLALSYAWPEAGAPTRTLPCNDRHISISEHVHTALENLVPLDAACAFAILIDAICIDQDNDIEKNKQVPHMGSIYSLASQVVIWVGPNEIVDQHREQIEYLSDHSKLVPWARWQGDLERLPFSEQGDEIWFAVGSMISSRWFWRLWTVQELCLAQKVDVLCGHCCLPWDSLMVLRCKAFHVDSGNGPAPNIQCLNICRSFQDLDASKIITRLENLRQLLVSKPVDKVYGLMFLLPKVLREKIEVDYSQENEYGSHMSNWHTSY